MEAARRGQMRSESESASKQEPTQALPSEACMLEWQGQLLGRWQRNAQGGLDLYIDRHMADAQQVLLMEKVAQFLADNVLTVPVTTRASRKKKDIKSESSTANAVAMQSIVAV